jgi:hypothetical protein
VPGDVADDQGDPRPWQPDRLVPVTADFDELAARQRCLTSMEDGYVSPVGSMARCRVSAVACSLLYRVAWSKNTADLAANSMPISMS